jgi:hypothetical protein
MQKKLDLETEEKLKNILHSLKEAKEDEGLKVVAITTERRLFEFKALKKLAELFNTDDITWHDFKSHCICGCDCAYDVLTKILIKRS